VPPRGSDARASPTRFLTADIPGLGGVIKQRPEDFLVDEQPLYQPCGQGEHIYLFVQKRGVSTMDLVEILARHFRVMRKAIGVAGLKDKHAITRQVVSVHTPGKTATDFPFLEHDRVQILWSDQHTNKLRRGHLRGNRFSIKVRGVSPAGVVTAHKVLQRLSVVGLPNRIGLQRFGMLGNNHLIGQALLTGDFRRACDLLLGPCPASPHMNPAGRAAYAAGDFAAARNTYPRNARAELRVLSRLLDGVDHRGAFLAIDSQVLGFFLSAFQSAVFNAVLDHRLAGPGIGTLVDGDLAMKHDNRACFAVDSSTLADPESERRLARLEISPTGPLWGVGLTRAASMVDAAEVAALVTFGITPELLHEWNRTRPGLLEGQRRPFRVPVIDPEVEGGVDEHGAYVRCAFELPRGSFATVVMEEVCKTAEPTTTDSADDDE
jgi:tRNA pseudouridine13 synthase